MKHRYILILIISIATALFTFCDNKFKIQNSIKCNKLNLFNDVKYLTDITPYRNYQNLKSLNKATVYIFDEFKKLDCQVNYQTFKAGGVDYKNVIASFNTDKKETVIIGAHYDVYGNQSGADDNASAVAGLLELARMIDKNNLNLKYRYDFVAFALEEPPYFKTEYMGSMVNAKSYFDKKINLKLMICLEMIGYYSNKKGTQDYPVDFLKYFYPDKGNFIALVTKFGQGNIVRRVKKLMKKASNIEIETLSAPESLEGIDFSDHQSFWHYKYNAIMVTDTAFNRNKNYHRNTDKIDTLNFDKMTEVINGLHWAIINY